jgi:hypothetical protein
MIQIFASGGLTAFVDGTGNILIEERLGRNAVTVERADALELAQALLRAAKARMGSAAKDQERRDTGDGKPADDPRPALLDD